MNRRKRPKNQDKGAPRWMVTFSDLVTLILVFFILLFSMSQIDLEKFQAVVDSFNQRQILDFPNAVPSEDLTEKTGESESTDKKDSSTKNEREEAANDQKMEDLGENELDGLGKLLKEIQLYLEKNGLDDVVVANRNERGVVLVLQEQVLFETGEAQILESAHPFLDKVGSLLVAIPNLVKVEGHTDNRPIHTNRFPSNWELSTSRASSVIRYLITSNQINANRFIAVGYGDTRPIVPNDSRENWQKNRRVEIVISDPKYSGE